MGKRGPTKKPAELKLLEGTFRKDRDTMGPRPRPLKPKYPSWLPRLAKLHWNKYAPILESLGLLTEIDGDEFARYCLYTVRARQAEEDIERRGLLVEGEKGGLVKNPSCQLARDYGAAASKLAAKFGLNPADRNGLPVYTEPDDDDPMSRLLSGPRDFER